MAKGIKDGAKEAEVRTMEVNVEFKEAKVRAKEAEVRTKEAEVADCEGRHSGFSLPVDGKILGCDRLQPKN